MRLLVILLITSKPSKTSTPNFLYLIRHQFNIFSENVVKFRWETFEKMSFNDVMSCDFQSKMAESLIDHRSFIIEANCTRIWRRKEI